MDQERIAEIKARADAATPGPWEAEGDGGITMDGVRDGYMVKVGGYGFPVSRARSSHRVQRQFDATFIAHARQDIPDLIAALEAANQRIVELMPPGPCDWGECNEVAEYWRLADLFAPEHALGYLPVCRAHGRPA